MTVRYEVDGAVVTVTIDRPAVRNAVDPETAVALREAFARYEDDEGLSVAILTGAGGTFCAGFDLKAIAAESGPPDEAWAGPWGRRGCFSPSR